MTIDVLLIQSIVEAGAVDSDGALEVPIIVDVPSLKSEDTVLHAAQCRTSKISLDSGTGEPCCFKKTEMVCTPNCVTEECLVLKSTLYTVNKDCTLT